jgi:hypothetical protein
MAHVRRSLILASVFVAACGHAPPAPVGQLPVTGLERFYCVDHADDGNCLIYRSPQPTAMQLATLATIYRVKSIIKLNIPWIPGDGGRDEAPRDVVVYAHPWLPLGPVDHDDVVSALDELDRAPKPVLVHCEHGEDRTGLLIGLWRVRHGSIAFSAWGEMRAFGFHQSIIGLTEVFERETGFSP